MKGTTPAIHRKNWFPDRVSKPEGEDGFRVMASDPNPNPNPNWNVRRRARVQVQQTGRRAHHHAQQTQVAQLAKLALGHHRVEHRAELGQLQHQPAMDAIRQADGIDPVHTVTI